MRILSSISTFKRSAIQRDGYVYLLVVETFQKIDSERLAPEKVLAIDITQYSFRLNIAHTHFNMLLDARYMWNLEFEEHESEGFQMYPGTFSA